MTRAYASADAGYFLPCRVLRGPVQRSKSGFGEDCLTMKFMISYTVVDQPSGNSGPAPRTVRVTNSNVVPLDDEARALPLTRRTNAVRAILLGEIVGEIQWAQN